MYPVQPCESTVRMLSASLSPVSGRLRLAGGSGVSECWVKDLYIKKCSLIPVVPEALGADVKAGTVFCVGCGISECFTGERLQCWLQAHVMADLGHDICCEIPKLIMSDGWEASSRATESVINTVKSQVAARWSTLQKTIGCFIHRVFFLYSQAEHMKL